MARKKIPPNISALLEEKTLQTFRSDWFCQSLLESEQSFDTLLGLSNSAQSELLVLRSKLTTKLEEEPDLVMSDLRFERVRQITRQTVNRARENESTRRILAKCRPSW